MNKIDQLGMLSTQVYQLYADWAKKQGIHINMLAVFYMLNKYKRCTQKQVCDEWIVPKQTISTLCKQLQQQGFIRFDASSQDKREKMMELTDKGHLFAHPILTKLHQLEQQLLAEFKEQEMMKLIDGLQRFTLLFKQIVDE